MEDICKDCSHSEEYDKVREGNLSSSGSNLQKLFTQPLLLSYDVSMKIPDSLGHWSSTLQVLWKEWNFRSFVIASFTFQLILVIMAPFRKQTSNFLVIISIWFSYLLADWVATQAIGLASKTLNNKNVDNAESNLTAFWAQFLLLHIGGPDTITALSLEDNELWPRTALQLGIQVYATLGVLVRSMRRSSLWIPTILMFLAGVIKYMERAISLFKGRLSNFVEETSYSEELEVAGISFSEDVRSNKELTNVDMAGHALYFFNQSKGLYTGQTICFTDEDSETYFSRGTIDEVFRLLEIELNLAYQAFYTKTVIIHKITGKILRPITILIEIVCLIFWWLSEKVGFHRYDIQITYTLLVGAIAVDVLAFFSILLSYWNISSLRKNFTVRGYLLNKLHSFGNRDWGAYKTKDEAPRLVSLRRAFFRKWSESIPQFNLISFYENRQSPEMQNVIEFFGIKDVLDKNRYVTGRWFSDDLRDHIAEWLHPGTHAMSRLVLEEYTFHKVDWAEWCKNYSESMGLMTGTFDEVFSNNLVESLIGWHIVTEVCYRAEMGEAEKEGEHYTDVELENCEANREMCKVLSNYMMYLLVWKPEALSISSVLSKGTLGEACDYVKFLIKSRSKVLSMDMEVERKPGYYVPDRLDSKFHTKDFKKMLRESMGMESKKIWKYMAGMWVMMLCYTAKHCKPSFYAARLKEGGELLSFIWLFMSHYGMGKKVDHKVVWGDPSLPLKDVDAASTSGSESV